MQSLLVSYDSQTLSSSSLPSDSQASATIPNLPLNARSATADAGILQILQDKVVLNNYLDIDTAVYLQWFTVIMIACINTPSTQRSVGLKSFVRELRTEFSVYNHTCCGIYSH